MRRLLGLGAGGTALAVAGGLALGGGAQADGDYRVDVVFDTAKGIVPGQLVKIAGARAGEVTDVELTRDYQARLQLTVDGKFAPFRADARCEIQPEGLISENFVQCDPGTPDARELQGGDGTAPTVPVERTSVPVNLTDLFDVFTTPVRQRFSILVSALGTGLAGNGGDVNALLRRANPALAATNRTLGILRRQRRQLADLVDAADEVAAELARRPERISRFIDSADRTLARTARRRAELRESVRRLPEFLDQARPTLDRLDAFLRDGTPVVRDLRRSGAEVAQLLREIPPAAAAARPALRALAPAAATGRRTSKDATPLAKQLATFASAALPTGQKLDKLVVDLRDRGVVEGLLKFIYYSGAATARYDGTSHIFPANLLVSPCIVFQQTATTPGCSARYDNGQQAAARTTPAPRETPRAPSGTSRPATPKLPGTPVTPGGRLPELPGTGGGSAPSVQQLADRLGDAVGGLLGGGRDGGGRGGPQALTPLLDLLLGDG